MKKNLIIFVLVGLLLLVVSFFLFRAVKGNKADLLHHQMLVQHVESLGKLELVRYTIQDVVEYEKYRSWLPNAKTLLVVHGEAVGCVDLSKVSAEDIHVEGDSVSIMLPYPELCYCKVDHQRSRVYLVEYGLWETANLVDDAYKYAEAQLYTEMKKTKMDAEVRTNAKKLLEPILNAMGFKRIRIDFQPYMQKSKEQGLKD